MIKLRLVCAAAALAATAGGTAIADTTANVGIMSDYIFRGVYQSEASAFAGIDIQADNGIYFGTWGTNVKDGLEYDLYFGYSGGGEELTWNIGYTGYFYTDDFDQTYEEINLGFSYGFLTLDYALGEYKKRDLITPPPGGQTNFMGEKQTYNYIGATFAPARGPYYFIGRTDYANVNGVFPYTIGNWTGTGANGMWIEMGKSFEIMEDLEIDVKALFSGDVPQGTSTSPASVQLGPSSAADSEYALVVTLTKTIRGIND